MQRIRTRHQFQAVMASAPVAKTPHFALHRAALDVAHAERLLFPVAEAWLGGCPAQALGAPRRDAQHPAPSGV